MDFLVAVWGQMITLLGGGLVSLAWMLWRWRKGEQLDPQVLWPTALALFLAGQAAWNEEHIARARSEAELARLTDVRRTELYAHIDERLTAISKDPPLVELYLLLTIIGRGADTILGGYALHVELPGRDRMYFLPRPIRPDVFTSDALGRPMADAFKISPTTALDLKTAVPVTRGSMRQGWMRFSLDGVTREEILDPRTRFWVSFFDYMSREHMSEPADFLDVQKIERPDCIECVCPGL